MMKYTWEHENKPIQITKSTFVHKFLYCHPNDLAYFLIQAKNRRILMDENSEKIFLRQTRPSIVHYLDSWSHVVITIPLEYQVDNL